MHSQRLVIAVVAVIGILATFMPWVRVPIAGTINGTKSDGWITLALFAVTLIICLLNDRTAILKGILLYIAIVTSLVAGIIGIWKIVDLNSTMADIAGNPFAKALGALVSVEFGLYLVAIAGILIPVLAFLIKEKRQLV